MKHTLTLLALLAICPAMHAQTDTTQVEPDRRNSIKIGISSKEGGYADLDIAEDSTKTPEPFTFETKRRKYIIHTERKPWISLEDSVQAQISDLRKERRRLFTYWAGLDIGVNTLLGPDNDADLSGDAEFMEIDNARSRFFAINFLEKKLEFGSHHAGLLTGLGLEFTSYHLRHNVLMRYDADSVYALEVESPEFRKNKLRQIGLRLPVMLEFNTKRARIPTEEQVRAGLGDEFTRKGNVHLAAGVVGSWYFDTMYKQKYRGETGRIKKDSDTGDYHLMPYRLAASVRFGVGAWNLFAEYALTPLFHENKGPELTPFNVGLTIIGFN